MSNFNFGTFEKETVVSSGNFLSAYNIYENVKFDGIEGPTTGTSAAGNDWKKWDFIFSCPEGSYKHSIFEPKTNERREMETNGNKIELPSEFETAMEFMKYVGKVFNPDGLAKLQKVSGSIKSFDQFIEAYKKCIGNPDTTTSLKLTGRNSNGSVYATIPSFLRINPKTHDVEIRNQFLGDKVGFTPYELEQKDKVANAKPSNIAAKVEKAEESDDLDLDDLGI